MKEFSSSQKHFN